MTLEWCGVSLSGGLHVPDSEGPHPLVMMMQGSGPADRDGNGYFDLIRGEFLRSGNAVFSFDKPGCGSSSGDWRDYALEARCDQVRSWLARLSTVPGLDSSRFGVWGQSQGGWMAQMLAGDAEPPAFAIAASGPSIGVEAQDLYAIEHAMRSEGEPDTQIEAALAFVRRAHAESRAGMPYDQAAELFIDEASNADWYRFTTVDGREDWELTGRFLVEGYEPTKALREVKCAFLAVYGGNDILLPAWESAEQCGRALAAAPTDDASVAVFPSADHRIQGNDGIVLDGYLSLLSGWLSSRVR